MSSKDIGPAVAVGPNLSIAAHEPRTRAWAFDAEFYSSMHPALVSDSDEIAANYIQEMLNTALVAKMLFSRLLCHRNDREIPNSAVMGPFL